MKLTDNTTEEPDKQDNFTRKLWELPEEQMIQRFIVAKRAGDPETALAILQAKALRAAEASAESTRELANKTTKLANATMWLAVATVVLAIATVALVVLTWVRPV